MPLYRVVTASEGVYPDILVKDPVDSLSGWNTLWYPRADNPLDYEGVHGTNTQVPYPESTLIDLTRRTCLGCALGSDR